MGINSPIRRLLKRLIYRTLGEWGYERAQAWIKARDIRSGVYTEREIALIAAAVRPGETAIDVGANFGLYTYHLARAVGPEGRVYAFEPVRFTHNTLFRIVRRLGLENVEVFPKGCGEREETLSFVVPLQESGAIIAGLSHAERIGESAAGPDVRRETCEIVRLDDFLPRTVCPSFMKLDTEGSEMFALRGAREMIARARPTIQCEVGREFMANYGLEMEEMRVFLGEIGHTPHIFDGNRLVPQTSMRGGNYIFIHPERRDRFGAHLAEL